MAGLGIRQDNPLAPSLNLPGLGTKSNDLMQQTGAINPPMQPDTVNPAWGVGAQGVRSLNQIISTILTLNESKRTRKDTMDRGKMEIALQRKAMILEYLLGNKNYSDRLKSLMANMSSSARSRAKGGSSLADLQASRATRNARS